MKARLVVLTAAAALFAVLPGRAIPPSGTQVVGGGAFAVAVGRACTGVGVLVASTVDEEGGHLVGTGVSGCSPDVSDQMTVSLFQDAALIGGPTTCPVESATCDVEGDFTMPPIDNPQTLIRLVVQYTWTSSGFNWRVASPLFCDGLGLVDQATIGCSVFVDLLANPPG